MTKTFEEILAGQVETVAQATRELEDRKRFDELHRWFAGLRPDPIRMPHFSERLAAFFDSPFFSVENDVAFISGILESRMESIHPNVFEDYLQVTHDEKLAALALKEFFGNAPEPEKELTHDSLVVYQAKRALAATRVMSPGQLPAFVTVAMGMFKFPGGVGNTPGFRGMLLGILSKAFPPKESMIGRSKFGGQAVPMDRAPRQIQSRHAVQARGDKGQPGSSRPAIQVGREGQGSQPKRDRGILVSGPMTSLADGVAAAAKELGMPVSEVQAEGASATQAS